MRRHSLHILITAVGFALGCDSEPQAPVLRNTPVYQSETEGFRFRVPDGWSQTANSSLPSGDVPKDIFLARYLVQTPLGGASLQILGRNDVPTDDLAEHLQQPSFGVAQWKVVEPLETITIGKQEADRLLLSGPLQGRGLLKHATCFHHNGRLYSFVGLYWKGDKNARQQIERAIESIIWE